MNNQNRKTLCAVFALPVPKNLEFRFLENLLIALDCELLEGNGSRVAFKYKELRLDLHRPHPGKEAKPYQIRAVREFLQSIGIRP